MDTPEPRNRRSRHSDLFERSLQRLDEALQFTPVLQPPGRDLTALNDVTLDLTGTSRLQDRRSLLVMPDLSLVDATVNTTSFPPALDQTSLMLGATFHDLSTTLAAACVGDEDPAARLTDGLCRRFLDCRRALAGPTQSLDLLHKYQQLCEQKLDRLDRLLRRAPAQQLSPQLTHARCLSQQLALERNTWRLLRDLLADELMDSGGEDAPMDCGPVSDVQLACRLFGRDPESRRAQLVVDWLERCAADDMLVGFRDKVEFFADSATGWENTLHALRRQYCDSRSAASQRQLTSSLDPDAPHRLQRHLHDVDAEDERRLMRYLFALLRAGRLDEAQRLCTRIGQPWRAATLEGWKLHEDPNYASASSAPVAGNPLRDLWRLSAWRLADDKSCDAYERAIYGSLCGHMDAVLAVCASWEDRVWALFRQLVDARVEEELSVGTQSLRRPLPLPDEYRSDGERRSSSALVFREVDALQAAHKSTSLSSAGADETPMKRLFNRLQQLAILGDTSGMAAELSSSCQQQTERGREEEWREDQLTEHRQLLRAAAHMALYLRQRADDAPLQDDCAAVLECYVRQLTADGAAELAVWYTAQLPAAAQTERLSELLEAVAESWTTEHGGAPEQDVRQDVLRLAERAGLDVRAACCLLVETCRGRPPRSAEDQLADRTTHDDTRLIAAVDWLLFDPAQRVEAMRQANAICRQFLLAHKLPAAAQLLSKLPDDSVAVVTQQWKDSTGVTDLPPMQAAVVREYLCIKALLLSQEAYEDWSDQFHNGRPRHPELRPGATFTETIAHEHQMKQFESSMERWRCSHAALTSSATQRLYNVLMFPDGGWMADPAPPPGLAGGSTAVDGNREADRLKQMAALRCSFLPQTVSVLQTILRATDQAKEAIQLADIIASERHAIYKHFSKQDLQSFLRGLREISLPILDQGMDAFGYPADTHNEVISAVK